MKEVNELVMGLSQRADSFAQLGVAVALKALSLKFKQ